jgi:hypothetical protein
VAAVVVAASLFAGVFGLRMSVGAPVDAYALLYTLPVALLAVTFGLRGGAAGGAVALLLTIVWASTQDVSMSVGAWLSRAVPLLLLGVLLGAATDRSRAAEQARRQAEAAAMLHREAVEINDHLVQGMVAARLALESGRVQTGLELLTATIGEGHRLVSDLIRRADMASAAQRLGAQAHE